MASPLNQISPDSIKEFASDAVKRSREFYDDLSERLPENTDVILGLAAAGAGIGLLGFLIGKSTARRISVPKAHALREPVREVTEAASKIDFTPLYKIIKLWMLYRIAV